MKRLNLTISLCLLLAHMPFSIEIADAGPSVNGDPYVDELTSNAFESQSPYWSEIKSLLTSGHLDEGLKRCRQVMSRRPLDIDMHCMYAMALEMKLRSGQYSDKLFDECVREWAKVAKAKIVARSEGWEHVGDGEVFLQNSERKATANRHLVSLVGRAPKYFESEEAFVRKAISTSTQVSGKVKTDKSL